MLSRSEAIKAVLCASLSSKGCCSDGAYLDVVVSEIFDSIKSDEWSAIDKLIAKAEKVYGKPAAPAVESSPPVISAAA